jgi:hypothetical protein
VREVAALLLLLGRRGSRNDVALATAHRRDTALQRELHHRVRNNLQIIGSHLAMGEADTNDEAARRVLGATRLRVAVLSLTHRLLWDSAEGEGLPVRTLVEAIANLAGPHLGAAVAVDVGGHAHDVRVNLDLAVPLSLWTIEALCALAPARNADGDADGLRLALHCGPTWSIAITAPAPAESLPSTACIKLLAGHAGQLPGGATRFDDPQRPTSVTLDFRPEIRSA